MVVKRFTRKIVAYRNVRYLVPKLYDIWSPNPEIVRWRYRKLFHETNNRRNRCDPQVSLLEFNLMLQMKVLCPNLSGSIWRQNWFKCRVWSSSRREERPVAIYQAFCGWNKWPIWATSSDCSACGRKRFPCRFWMNKQSSNCEVQESQARFNHYWECFIPFPLSLCWYSRTIW